MKREVAEKLAKKFIAEHSPDNWDGSGEPTKGFSKICQMLKTSDPTVNLTIRFTRMAGENGAFVWGTTCQLVNNGNWKTIDRLSDIGVDQDRALTDAIMTICEQHNISID